METEPKLNLYQKILKIQSEINYIEAKKVDKVRYKVILRNDVLRLITPLLEKYKLLLLPSNDGVSNIDYKLTFYETSEGYKKYIGHASLTQSWCLVNVEDPSERYQFIVSSTGNNELGFHAGQIALSINQKYAIITLFNLEVGDVEQGEGENKTYSKSTSKTIENKKDINIPDLKKSDVDYIGENEIKLLKELCVKAKVSESTLCKAIGDNCKDLTYIPKRNYLELVTRCNDRIKSIENMDKK